MMSGPVSFPSLDAAATAVDRSQGDEAARQIAILKKAIDLEKNTVEKLLPQPSGRLDIRA